MADLKYFRKIIAKDLGVKVKDLTIDMIDAYIGRQEKEATHCAFEMASLIGICTTMAHRISSGLYEFRSYEEEIRLMNYIHTWNE